MNIRKITSRAVIAGMTTALAAGALVGVTGTAANAATGVSQYNCTNPYTADVLPLSLSATADLTAFPSFPSGFEVPDGIVAVGIQIGLSPEAVAGLKAGGITTFGADSTGMNFPFGPTSAPLKGFSVPSAALPDTGGFTMTAETSNAPFDLPVPGTHELTMPAAFSLTAPTNLIALPLTCTVAGDKGSITSYTVTKQNATVKAAPKTVKKNKPFSLVAKVTGDNKTATGKVSVKLGKKTIGTGKLKAGKATVKIAKGLKKTSKVTVVYAGDASTNGAKSAPVKITVKR
jgi:hypothetical protein